MSLTRIITLLSCACLLPASFAGSAQAQSIIDEFLTGDDRIEGGSGDDTLDGG